MSTLALDRSSGAETGRLAGVAGYADLVFLALALPVFLVADLPLAGYLAASAGWLAQRGVQHLAEARLARADQRTTALGLIGGSIVARLWILTLAVLIVGLVVDDAAGLAAAALAAALVTVGLVGEGIARTAAPSRDAA